MHAVPETLEFHATIAEPIVDINSGDATGGYPVALAVEIPLMVFALTTVIMRVYSRLTIKRKASGPCMNCMRGTY
jgi:hypothetical protein